MNMTRNLISSSKFARILDYEMPRTDENIRKIAQFIKRFVDREGCMEFDVSAVCAIVEYPPERQSGR